MSELEWIVISGVPFVLGLSVLLVLVMLAILFVKDSVKIQLFKRGYGTELFRRQTAFTILKRLGVDMHRSRALFIKLDYGHIHASRLPWMHDGKTVQYLSTACGKGVGYYRFNTMGCKHISLPLEEVARMQVQPGDNLYWVVEKDYGTECPEWLSSVLSAMAEELWKGHRGYHFLVYHADSKSMSLWLAGDPKVLNNWK